MGGKNLSQGVLKFFPIDIKKIPDRCCKKIVMVTSTKT